MTGELQDNDRVLYDWPPRNDANPSNVPPWKFVLNSNQRLSDSTTLPECGVTLVLVFSSLFQEHVVLFSLVRLSSGGSHAGHRRNACQNKRALQLDKHWTHTHMFVGIIKK